MNMKYEELLFICAHKAYWLDSWLWMMVDDYLINDGFGQWMLVFELGQLVKEVLVKGVHRSRIEW